MTIGGRIKKVRRELELTQTEFASRLGLTQNTVTRYETGDRNPSTAVLSLIVKAYGVNEEWLRTGEGEMFIAAPSGVLNALAQEYGLRQKDYVLIEKLVKMSPAERDGIFHFMQDVVDGARGCGADPDSPVFPGGSVQPQEMSPEQLHAELDRQLSDQEGQTGGLSAYGRSS